MRERKPQTAAEGKTGRDRPWLESFVGRACRRRHVAVAGSARRERGAMIVARARMQFEVLVKRA